MTRRRGDRGRDVSKRFRIYREKPTSLKQRVLSARTRAEDFWALRDVTFDVPRADARSR